MLQDAPSREDMPHLPATKRAEPPADTPRIVSHHLLDGARELVIDHNGHEYRLRLTRNDKLILTK